jgi:hypothetical protein
MTSRFRARLPRAIALAALAILPWLGTSAVAQAWPAKPVRIVFPYSAGGPVDVLLRALAMRMSETMGQQFVVENRPGANEIIAAEAVARAAPDGYTLLFASDAVFSLNPHLYSKLPYDANKDFTPIARVINAYLMLVGRTDLPPKDLKELFAYIKANNGKVSYGSVGLGSVNHLSMSWLANEQGLEMIHVPFKGRRADGAGDRREPARPRLRGDRRRAAVPESEPGEGLRSVSAGADGGDPEHADVHRARLPGAERLVLLRARGAGRHVAGDHLESPRRQGRSSPRPSSARSTWTRSASCRWPRRPAQFASSSSATARTRRSVKVSGAKLD